MFKDNKKNIFDREKLDFSLISLFSSKLRIGVIGAGKAGYIKAKHFLKQGCFVEVITLEKNNLFKNIKYDNLKITIRSYEKSFIYDKHIIIIAIDNLEKVTEIKKDCDEIYKIYIDSTSFKNGMGSVPMQKEFNNFTFAINTKGGNPKGAVFLSKKAEKYLEKYDDYIGFITKIRNKAKVNNETKREVINFITSDDFFFFFKKNQTNNILRMFYEEKTFNRKVHGGLIYESNYSI